MGDRLDLRYYNQENLTKVAIKQRPEDVKEGAMKTSIGKAFQAEETTNQRPPR